MMLRPQTCLMMTLLPLLGDQPGACTSEVDTDGDGWPACGEQDPTPPMNCDCDDSNGLTYPGASEANSSGDDDCDGISEWGIDLQSNGYSYGEPIAFADGDVIALVSGRADRYSRDGSLLGSLRVYVDNDSTCSIRQQVAALSGEWTVLGSVYIESLGASRPCFGLVDKETGTPLVMRILDDLGGTTPNSMIQVRDGGYVIAGYVTASDGLKSAVVYKLSEQGILEWYSSSWTVEGSDSYFRDVGESPSGDLLLVGQNYHLSPSTGVWVLRTSPQGDIQWQLTDAQLPDLKQGTSVAVGRGEEAVVVSPHIEGGRCVYAVASSSTQLWEDCFSSELILSYVNLSPDGTFLVLGGSDGKSSTTRIGADGSLIWVNKTLKNDAALNDFIIHPDGGYVMTGITNNLSPWENEHGILLRVDELANGVPVTYLADEGGP